MYELDKLECEIERLQEEIKNLNWMVYSLYAGIVLMMFLY
jgi:hypothetical protein